MAIRTQSSDPRAERIRTRVRDAAFALAHERPVDELTVTELVTRAGISRQGFYLHYADRDDAVATAIATTFAAAAAAIDGDARARITALFDFAAEHRSAYRNVVPSAVTQRVVATFRAELLPACDELAARGLRATGSTAASLDAVSRFLVGGFQEVLRSWMEDPDPAPDLRVRVTTALDTVDALLGSTST